VKSSLLVFLQANIRQNLSTLSFEELLKLKDTLGAKVYNETVFGAPQPKPKPVVKRENKNRPREVSSKIRLKHLKAILNPGWYPLILKLLAVKSVFRFRGCKCNCRKQRP